MGSLPQVSGAVFQNASAHRTAFENARPFKHVVIEDFFDPAFAERVLADFPSFKTDLARNEGGNTGGKAVNTKIREISPVYQELFDAISSKTFLDLASSLSGIPDLILDPKLYGGGTHDNQHGQELDPHVDFNYDESRSLHRRLNLIVYLNHEWRGEWGGALEIHSNPRDPFRNQVASYDPIFNRCVMFETNEYSWHGFPRIDLPADKRHLSRKSVSIYLYTKDRPANEIVPEHGTFYVQRFLPENIVAGHTLTENEVGELGRLLLRRDQWIEFYQRMELEKNRQIGVQTQSIRELTSRVRTPLTGYAQQAGAAKGVYADGWAASEVELQIQPLLPISGIVLRGWLPDSMPHGRVHLSVAGGRPVEQKVGGGEFEIKADLKQAAKEPVTLTARFESSGPAASSDNRDLAYILMEVRSLHPGVKHP